MSHVGIVAIVFAVMGAVYILRFRRGEAVWVILSALAFLLSLGIVFHVNGEPLNIYWTPYRLLQDNFFFRALWHPFRMIIVLLLPLFHPGRLRLAGQTANPAAGSLGLVPASRVSRDAALWHESVSYRHAGFTSPSLSVRFEDAAGGGSH